MRTVLCLSATLSLLALAPACGDDGGSASETSGSTSAAAGSEESGSAVGSGTTMATSGTAPGTNSTSTTGPGSETTDDPTTTGPATTDATAEGTTQATDASTGASADPPPPTDAATLLPWLEAGSYSDWDAEAERHPSRGPHFQGVQTFVNATLLESLEVGGDDHPVGSSVVKELYGPGAPVGGWAVMVKVAPGTSVDNWYWYESFEGTEYADGTGVALCGNCHNRGVDFVRTTLPL